MARCGAGGVTLPLGDGFTPQEEVTEGNILPAVMVNPRISAAINTYYASDNYLPEGKPLFDTLASDGVAVLVICADASAGSDPDRRHTCSGDKTGDKNRNYDDSRR